MAIIEGSCSTWRNIESTLVHFYVFEKIFIVSKWPNIENIDKPSSHTGRHVASSYDECYIICELKEVTEVTFVQVNFILRCIIYPLISHKSTIKNLLLDSPLL